MTTPTPNESATGPTSLILQALKADIAAALEDARAIPADAYGEYGRAAADAYVQGLINALHIVATHSPRVDPALLHTEPISDRGFHAATALDGIGGGEVCVWESSLADRDALWLRVDDSRDDHKATIQLDVDTALVLSEQIRVLAALRGYPRDEQDTTP